MVEVTCDRCGNLHRLADAEVPPSGKVMKCAACAAPVTVMPPNADDLGLRPRSPAGGRAPMKSGGGTTDVSALPAVDRPSPLAGIDMPPPKERAPVLPKAAAVPPSERYVELDSDLPRPVGPSPRGRGASVETDLPAPVGPTSARGGIADLPAPVGPTSRRSIADLPAPVRPGGPGPGAKPPIPSGPSARPPIPGGPGGRPPIPAGAKAPPVPAAARPAPPPAASIADLPAPKGFFDDLPGDRSAPRADIGIADLPAPKGFFEDLPGDKSASRADVGPADLLAPKGFFDDIPAPASGPGSAGARSDQLAPKGFFDDIPAPTSGPGSAGSPASRADADLLAPKGFFDNNSLDIDLGPSGTVGGIGGRAPLPPASAQAAGAIPLDLDGLDVDAGRPRSLSSVPPLDLGDPLGAPSRGKSASSIPPLDLGDPIPSRGGRGGAHAPPLDLGDPLGGGDIGLSFDDGPRSTHSQSLELPDLAPPGGPGDPFSRVELPDIDTKPAPGGAAPKSPPGVVTFNAPTARPAGGTRPPAPARGFGGGAAAPELDVETAKPTAAAAKKKKATIASEAKAAAATDEPRRARGSSRKLIAIILGVGLAGAAAFGGFILYSNWSEKRASEQAATSGLENARKQMLEDSPGHWDRAAKQAQMALAANPSNADALGIAAQASFAALLDDGRDAARRRALGRKAITDMRGVDAKGLEAEKAEALQSITERRLPDAIKRLLAVQQQAPDDLNAQLYLGWAFAAQRDHAKAETAFGKVLAKSPNRLAALYGLAQAQLELGKVKEAREAFQKVSQLSRDKYKVDHIGALVGIAQLSEEGRFGDRELRFLEITERQGLEQADPRAVSRALSFAGDEALKAGRADVAAQRFEAALARDPENLHALVGQSQVELRRNNAGAARTGLERVLARDPTNIGAMLTLAEVALAEDLPDEAKKLVTQVLERKPPVTAAEEARGRIVMAGVLEKNPDKVEEAIAEYRRAIEVSGPAAVGPRVALSRLLAKSGRAEEALAELQPIRDAAEQDPALAVLLGVAYLDSGDAVRAEACFRAALTRQPGDVEATFQLGVALFAQGKHDEGLNQLKTAFAANEGREDIGLRLAKMYEQLGRDGDAGGLYDRLLAAAEPSINARAQAGRYYARIGQFERAQALGEAIAATQPHHPAALFLAAEQLYRAGKFDEARSKYGEAVRVDPQPQFLDGLARAGEQLQLFPDALENYARASNLDPKYLPPRLGKARIHLARAEYSEALQTLVDARAIDDKSPEIHAGMGECYQKMSKYAEAAAAYEKAIALDGKNAQYRFGAGEAYFDLDKPGPAAGSLAKAVELATGDEKWLNKAYERLGRAAALSGDRGTAIRAYESLLDRVSDTSIEARDAKRELLRLQAR